MAVKLTFATLKYFSINHVIQSFFQFAITIEIFVNTFLPLTTDVVGLRQQFQFSQRGDRF